MRKILLSGVALLVAAPALSQEYRLVPRPPQTSVIVWKSPAAQKEAQELISAGLHKTKPELFDQLIACMAGGGTAAVVTNNGPFTHEVLVADGPSAGCRGAVSALETQKQ